ncbi:histone-like nucleoid-structuring protein Lsr2 [Psychromicrobium xiongbiense]|uniref:histone-like nucleoid-structuring protein Lsr2 n=1 Tax=Psychromicrobium xiongbiense TaxID=3051184 RepID=UPI002556DB10|nr:Lsr2 family protein [Psychromicrobium sp. YIM S02556]
MAQRVKIILVDDLDGGTADETVRFGLDGATYEIDLSKLHAAELRDAIRPYLNAARRATARSARAGRPAVTRPNEISQIRQWARDNGHSVSDRGRIPAEIVEAYRKANG